MRQRRGVKVDVAVLPTMVRILGGLGVVSGWGVEAEGARHMEVMMTWGIL